VCQDHDIYLLREIFSSISSQLWIRTQDPLAPTAASQCTRRAGIARSQVAVFKDVVEYWRKEQSSIILVWYQEMSGRTALVSHRVSSAPLVSNAAAQRITTYSDTIELIYSYQSFYPSISHFPFPLHLLPTKPARNPFLSLRRLLLDRGIKFINCRIQIFARLLTQLVELGISIFLPLLGSLLRVAQLGPRAIDLFITLCVREALERIDVRKVEERNVTNSAVYFRSSTGCGRLSFFLDFLRLTR
jgi:hypothetical protein